MAEQAGPAKRPCRLALAQCDGTCHKFCNVPANGSSKIWLVLRVNGVNTNEAFCELCHSVIGYDGSNSSLQRHLITGHLDTFLFI